MEVWEAEKHAALVMQRCLNRITDGALVKGWTQWLEVMDAEENAAAVMQGCLVRIENGVLSVAMDQWLDVVQWSSQSAVDARQAQAMRELEAARAQVEKDKEEKAGRLMQYCLNKIINTQYVQAWDRWMSVHKAMLRAGRIMHRTVSYTHLTLPTKA